MIVERIYCLYMNIDQSIWCEKYRPKKISDFVFSDDNQKMIINKWISAKEIPNLLFFGKPGTGKTSLALILVNELEIDPYDMLFINASRENNVDIMRDKISNFAATAPWGKTRVIILDEFDYTTQNAQAILRGLMQQYLTTRFILTCNYSTRIIPAIHSRVQSLEINRLPMLDFTTKMAEILLAENIEFELDILDDYVRGCWPDLRKCINNCQQNCIDGKLISAQNSNNSSQDYKIESVELFKQGKFREARTLICNQICAEELEEFFTFLYKNLDLWGSTEKEKDAAILKIRNGMIQIPMAADPEILVSAVITELLNIKEV